jgi:hypothetical protein
MAVFLHVADHRLDADAPPDLAADGGRDAAPLSGEEDPLPVGIVAAVVTVDVGTLDGNPGDALGLGNRGSEGVTVEGVARQSAGADDELAAGCGAVVVASETLQPNSKRVRALPLPLHSSSEACWA